jgi:23S rRNA (pseudouridine1915-N3)-methyltransferase
MRLEVISISNKLSKWEDDTLNFYLKQISSIIDITIQNIKPAKGSNLNIKEVQTNEEKNILKKVKPDSLIISFDRKGKHLDSLQFSELTQSFLSSGKNCYLIIGGSYGLSDAFLGKSDHVISFSALTFPHKLFKILLIEQLYRSITIIKNKPYHK